MASEHACKRFRRGRSILARETRGVNSRRVRAYQLAPARYVRADAKGAHIKTLFATDLDDTLIYPLAARAPRKINRTSGMTREAAALLEQVREHVSLAVVTTRAPIALEDLDLPGGRPELLAATNGARIYENGAEDRDWAQYVRDEVVDQSELEAALRDLGSRGHPEAFVRDGVYVKASVGSREDLGRVEGVAQEHGLQLSVQRGKLHLLPRALTKGAALQELKRRAGAARTLAAGDSLLDLDMLHAAQLAARPPHGELHEVGDNLEGIHVTTRPGPEAAEDILRWVLEHL